MPADDQEVLRAYLQRVMELSEQRSSQPTHVELAAIAREIGISEEDLAAAEQSADDHRVRGTGFLEFGRFDDAISELLEASVLAPSRLDIKHDLARAYAGRYRRAHQDADRQRAESLARQHLEVDPRHRGSFELISELDAIGPPSLAGVAPGQAGSGRARTKMLVVAGLLILGILLFSRLATQAPSPTPPAAQSTAAVPEGPAPESPAPAPNAPAVALEDPEAPEAARTLEIDIPIELETDLELAFDVRRSRLKNYATGKSFYTLNAVIENQGATELEKVSAVLNLWRKTGGTLVSEPIELLSSSAPPLRPGDAHAIHKLLEVHDPNLRLADLTVERVDQVPAADSYGVAQPLPVQWAVPQPPGIEISVRERSRHFNKSAFGDKRGGFFESVIEIENTGDRAIRRLKLKGMVSGPASAGAANAWTTEVERYAATSQGPDLRQGGQRVVRFLTQVEGAPESFTVSVVDIR
ncbi:MAG: hypothetical protein AAGM22_05365 [Acidobacteriota bacterium]